MGKLAKKTNIHHPKEAEEKKNGVLLLDCW
jgi:hypothetical protein